MTYLCKTKSHLPPVEVTFVELCSCLRGRQGIAEVNPHPAETLEELEGDVSVEGTKQLLETGLRARENRQVHEVHLAIHVFMERHI